MIFTDGSQTEQVTVDSPIGHRRRRAEGIPVLQAKFERDIATRLSAKKYQALVEICAEQSRLEQFPVSVMDLLAL